MKAEIVIAVATVALRVHVAHTLHGPGQQPEVGKFVQAEIDTGGLVGDGVKRHPGQPAVVQ